MTNDTEGGMQPPPTRTPYPKHCRPDSKPTHGNKRAVRSIIYRAVLNTTSCHLDYRYILRYRRTHRFNLFSNTRGGGEINAPSGGGAKQYSKSIFPTFPVLRLEQPLKHLMALPLYRQMILYITPPPGGYITFPKLVSPLSYN